VITKTARAKINLTLEVLGRRADGYHQIASLIAFADDAFDTVTLDISRPVGVTVSGPFASAVVGENIVGRALALLADAEPRLKLGTLIIEKQLPVAAGLGGGSADAAAALRAIRNVNPDLAAHIDWASLAATLGADVSVCFRNQACWVTGVGEELAPLTALPPLGVVLMNPMAEVPPDKTAQVFRQLRAPLGTEGAEATSPPAGTLHDTASLIEFMTRAGNHLQRPATAVIPEISETLRIIRQTPGCRFAGLSGAGPTCFGVFDEPAAIAEGLQQEHPGYWIRSTRIAL
jgi:4-diphosphocytidyl-2-C-methyl-D-erythritol kinase